MYTGVPGVGTRVWKNRAVAAAGRHVADEGDLVASVEDQDLIGKVDLDSERPAPGGELGRLRRVRQGLARDGASLTGRGDALDLPECPHRLERVLAELAVGRARVVVQRGEPLLQLHDVGTAHAERENASRGGRGRRRRGRRWCGRGCGGDGDAAAELVGGAPAASRPSSAAARSGGSRMGTEQ
ncbi:MAG TPA: hypothetical protein VMC83_11285 [Streptosporangiaceae bacterium]|nr:hypothetical protein [Streptosporangiaceae bacterium]